MAPSFKYLAFAIFFLALINRGSSICNARNINIATTRSGRIISGKTEWNVNVINNCPCIQSQIKLSCQGFQTVEPVSPSILYQQGDTCLLQSGFPLQGFGSVRFSYARDPAYVFFPKSSVVTGCP